jgi:hypothetical protein
MRNRLLILVLLAAAAVALKGDNCVLENREVEIPLRGHEILPFTSQGEDDTDVEYIDFGETLREIEEDSDSDIDTLISVTLENVYWRLKENRGSPSTTVNSGDITVTRISTGESEVAINISGLLIQSVPDFVRPAGLREEAVNLLRDGLAEYLAHRNEGAPMPDLNYRFDWATSGAPAPVDFDWEVKLDFTIVGVFSVEVPDIFDP